VALEIMFTGKLTSGKFKNRIRETFEQINYFDIDEITELIWIRAKFYARW